MSELRVIVDQLVARVPGGIGRYTAELTRSLVETAPGGWDVVGVLSNSPETDRARIRSMIPGLSGLDATALSRRELSLAWSLGLARPRWGGAVHAPSLLAPVFRRGRRRAPGARLAVTIHDAVPWTHPETLTPHGVRWHRAMARRAERFADAIVVDTHAVARELSEHFDFGDRVHVIGAAVGSDLALPTDDEARAGALRLPDRYLLAVGSLEPRKALDQLVTALAETPADVPLLIVGAGGWGGVDIDALIAEAGLAPGRVRALGRLADADLAVVLSRASVFVFPSLAEGFGLPVLEAFTLGTPVVHSDAPAVAEVAGGAGLEVPRADPSGYPRRLAEAIRSVLEDPALAARLAARGRARASEFSWRESAEQVWRLHTEL